MSSTGTILLTTPLLPCLPAILSPGINLLFTATKTLTTFITVGSKSSPCCIFVTLSSNLNFISSDALSNWFFNFSKSLFSSSFSKDNFHKLFRVKFSKSLKFSVVPGFRLSNCFLILWPLSKSIARNLIFLFSISSSTFLSSWTASISARSIAIDLSSFSIPCLLKTLTSITTPVLPEGSFNDESLTSVAFSPKIDLNNFSSGLDEVSLLGVTLPTKISLGLTSAPT